MTSDLIPSENRPTSENGALPNATLTILGCGTSTGVPIPGCRCEVCTSTHPRNTRLRTSAFISLASGENILIDASPDIRHQALTYGIDHLDAVFYTHAHADHILGTDDLRVFNFRKRVPIPCYGTQETLDSLQDFFHYIFKPNPHYEGGLLANLEAIPIQYNTRIPVAGVEILPLELYHGKLSVTSFRCGDLVYATDCNDIPETSLKEMYGVPILILDALRYEPHNTHYTLPQAIEVAQKLKAKETYLIHMAHSIEYEAVSKDLPPNIHLAYDGLKLPFSTAFNPL
ncbi:MAG: MBL fold metallo-hydrolase [Bdellovibrionales bacterium]|nr:MBL fold metallo-hydrolase [Bdellovibrionales bacterium]